MGMITEVTQMTISRNKKITKRAWNLGKPGLLLLAAFLLVPAGCYIPGLSMLPEADNPPDAKDPGGVEETLYGKFFIYWVGDGKVGGGVDYMVGDVTYYPSPDLTESDDYNFTLYGNEPNSKITFKHKDWISQQRSASGRPEGAVLNGQLAIYYTNSRFGTNGNDGYPADNGGLAFELNCTDSVGDTISTAQLVSLNSVNRAMFSLPNGDVDFFSFYLPGPSLVVVRGKFSSLHGGRTFKISDISHRMSLTLKKRDGSVVGQSQQGMDFWKYRDPEISAHLDGGTTYYVRVDDLHAGVCNGSAWQASRYWIIVDTIYNADENLIMKGEIQPARSGNPAYNGGPTFEPDDLSTLIEDEWPDCDGVPGSGDEGDAGVTETCGFFNDWGAGDGVMQYQEVDDKAAIDDGEYFVGKTTNVPAVMDTEASIVKAPDRENLLMFVNYGSRIYMLESEDGMVGRQWDLSNLVNDMPAVIPLNSTFEGAAYVPPVDRLKNDVPVVSSGKLGYCDTYPGLGDTVADPRMLQYDVYGTPARHAPVGYPDTVAITFGGNQVIDSLALVDDFNVAGDAITSGPDGIVNTFFAPEHEAYEHRQRIEDPWVMGVSEVVPGSTDYRGPANPPNPRMWYPTTTSYGYPLSGLGGTNTGGFLIGDDLWNPDVFMADTTSPPAYWRKQRCYFYSQGDQFDKCGMGSPIDPSTCTVPGDPRTCEEPRSILSGSDGRLDTVTEVLRTYYGDDVLCGDSINPVAICPGPDNRFGMADIYLPLKGDDMIEIVEETQGPFAGQRIVGIGSGPNHVMETPIIDKYTESVLNTCNNWLTKWGIPLPGKACNLADLEDFVIHLAGDLRCQTLDGYSAICPGFEAEVDALSQTPMPGTSIPTETRRLLSIWTMYMGSPSEFLYDSTQGLAFLPIKKDLYYTFDDEFCIVDNQVAICPGENGYFQSYALNRKILLDEDEDLFNLYDRVEDKLGKTCYSMVSEQVWDDWAEEDRHVYRFYRYVGVYFDDKIQWDDASGRYYMSTGENGINQSCPSASDQVMIPYHQGLPDVPVIVRGGGIWDNYPLADELFYWGDGVYKIGTGDDGIANSYRMGDDRLEVFMGTGKPDYPCVISGDGEADTMAVGNDVQLYQPGEYTGFDAFATVGPEALVRGNSIYLYYTAVGWEKLGEMFRDGAGALGSKGECDRAGLDYMWGRRGRVSDFDGTSYDWWLKEVLFRELIDNSPGVMIAPRIGLATASMSCLRNPASYGLTQFECWDFSNRPVVDVGNRCAGDLEFPIDLDLSIGLIPDINWSGLYSPEIKVTDSPDGEGDLYIMFYSGLSEGSKEVTDENQGYQLESRSQVGVARSLDGRNWQLIRDLNPPVIAAPFLDFLTLIESGSAIQYGYPTVVSEGDDEFGEPMYGMFFNQFEVSFYNAGSLMDKPQNYDLRKKDHIGFAIRRGKASMSCSLGNDYWSSRPEKMRQVIQMAVLAVPFILIFAVRRSRRRA